MADDPSVRLRAVLAELRRVPDILGAAIVGTSEMAAGEMGLGTFSQSIVDTNIGKMMATGAGEEAILVTMVRNEANMGLILLSVDKAVHSIAEILRSQEVVV